MHRVVIPKIGAAHAWRDSARALLAAGVPPSEVSWNEEHAAPGLFDREEELRPGRAVTVPRGFLPMAESVVWHSDPDRFARLYAFLWRLRRRPGLMSDRGDAALAALRRMEKNVHRCQHKMKAFVRFREIDGTASGRRAFAAWFEPTHHTVEPTADFFVRRFADMDWRILTPDICAVFESGKLRLEKGMARPDLPPDASEELWITYFRNIFNPARLKLRAMQSEMPKKYWKNMPETAAIPELVATAPQRARAMQAAAPTLPSQRTDKVRGQLCAHDSAWNGPAEGLARAVQGCTRCPLHAAATQAVPGEGPRDAALMIVGEQPGDLEDLQGRPFVGPAGQLFDRIAAEAGLDRAQTYVTNAVKHFKFQPRGRRRLHQRPTAGEVQHCKWWLDAERDMIRPRLILGLGATAALALTGRGEGLTARRGHIETTPDGTRVLLTWHPSRLLRLRDPAERHAATDQFRTDLATAASLTQRAESSEIEGNANGAAGED